MNAMSDQHSARAPQQRLLAVLIALGILSTAVHYAHNFAMADCYPPIGWVDARAFRIGIVVFWPLCTASALLGYRLYAQGRDRAAQLALLAYTPLGLTTPLHFLGGTPDIPPFFMATIFTDFLTSFAILAFALWLSSARAAGRARR